MKNFDFRIDLVKGVEPEILKNLYNEFNEAHKQFLIKQRVLIQKVFPANDSLQFTLIKASCRKFSNYGNHL